MIKIIYLSFCHVCMYVRICMHVFLQLYLRICMYVHTQTHVYVFMDVCMYLSIYPSIHPSSILSFSSLSPTLSLSLSLYIYIYIHIGWRYQFLLPPFRHPHIYMSIYLCIYTSIHLYIYTSIYLYIYVSISLCLYDVCMCVEVHGSSSAEVDTPHVW